MTSEEYEKELRRLAPMVCCTRCGEKKCAGSDTCKEIKAYVERKLKG